MSYLSPDPLVARLSEMLHAAKDLETALRSIAKDIGVSNVSYARFSSGKRSDAKLMTAKVTYPFRWQATYFLKQYASIDPVITHGKSAVRPFDWEDLMTDDPAVRQFFEDAARHGVGQNGYSIPVRPDPDADFSLVSFNSDHRKEEWAPFKAENAARMAQLAVLIDAAALNDLKRHTQPSFLSRRRSTDDNRSLLASTPPPWSRLPLSGPTT
jgi:hypothetical protein